MQDGSGSYRYSFTGPHHAKTESNLNGVTQGGKSSSFSFRYSVRTCRIVQPLYLSRASFVITIVKYTRKLILYSSLSTFDAVNCVERREGGGAVREKKILSPDDGR